MSEEPRSSRDTDDENRLAARDLLPLVYDELRHLAERQMRCEAKDLTLQATALVNEAYIRIVGESDAPRWNHRGHFYVAAATAMRRILVERARRKCSKKHGGSFRRQPLTDIVANDIDQRIDLIALDEVLEKLEQHQPDLAQIVSLRFFAGLTMSDAAETMGISLRAAERKWTYAKAWLLSELNRE